MVDRIQKTIEHANIKLASVAWNLVGKSRRDMLESIVSGEIDAEWAASRTNNTYLAAQYRRLAARRGK